MPALPNIQVDPLLTNISVAYVNEEFVADQVFPSLPVGPRTGKYYIYNKEAFLRSSGLNSDGKSKTLRKPTSHAAEITFELSQDTYKAERRSIASPVSDDEMVESMEQGQGVLAPQMDHALQVTERMSIDLEREAAALGCSTTSFPSSNKELLTTGGSGTSWASYTSTASDPFKQIRNAKLGVRKGILREPNQMLLSIDAAVTLADHPLVKELVKYTNPDALTQSGLPRVVRGLNIIEGAAQYINSAEGATVTSSNIWVDENGTQIALIFYRSQNLGQRSVHFGRTFDAPDATTGVRGLAMRTYRDEPRASLVVEGNRTYDLKLIARDSNEDSLGGYLVSGTTI